jgi:hypothetical protein
MTATPHRSGRALPVTGDRLDTTRATLRAALARLEALSGATYLAPSGELSRAPRPGPWAALVARMRRDGVELPRRAHARLSEAWLGTAPRRELVAAVARWALDGVQ